MNHVWMLWQHSPPSPDLDVVGWWGDMPEDPKGHDGRGRSCKRGGCCFVADCGELLVPPKWWRPERASDQQEAAR